MVFSYKLAATLALASLANSAARRPARRRKKKREKKIRIEIVHREEKPLKNLVDVAATNGFNTLVAAVKAAGLVETLQGPGPFTVFAPTDEAFAKLPEGTLDELLKPENKDRLVDILTYHVVAARVTADEAFDVDTAETVQGDTLKFRIRKGNLKINNATVTDADIEASNGIIHVIDTVLLPPED